MLNFFITVIYTLFSLALLKVFHSTKRGNPVYWFVVFQWVMAVGSFQVLDLNNDADVLYMVLYFAALLSFAAGALLMVVNTSYRHSYHTFFERPFEPPAQITRHIVVGMALFSTLVTLGYYQIVGYNLFIETLVGADIVDFKSARLATYSGEDYYAPGFVNQFKNTLLIVCWMTILTWMFMERQITRVRILSVPILFLFLYALMGTGQRAPMVYAFLAVIFGISLITKVEIKRAMVAFFGLSMLFGFFSVLNERVDSFSITSSFEAFASRVFINDQQEGLFAFREIVRQDSAWFTEWLDGFAGLSPWSKGSTLTHEIYMLIHGTDRGTAGVTTVGSAYHNGGFLNVVAFYFLMGVGYMALFRRFLSGPKNILRCYTYGFIFFIFAIYIAGPPVVLFNKGLLALILMLFLAKLRTHQRQPQAPMVSARSGY